VQSFAVEGLGHFEVEFQLDEMRPGARLVHRVDCLDTFVPAEAGINSGDTRRLAFLLESCELVS
jgi:hypothetical protein